MDGLDSGFLRDLLDIPTDNSSSSESQLVDPMQDLNVSGPLGSIIRRTIGDEITNNVEQKVYTIPVSAPILNHQLEIVNQPEKNDYKFR